MKCPYCGFDDQKVLDSRPARDGEAIRRRRECLKCSRRFTTFEAPERPRLFVIKRDGTYEDFQREKVLNSMIIACRKRPVTMDRLRAASEWIERDLFSEYEEEVASKVIGEKVMEHLRFIDQVAYVRFASVYREFQSISEFREIVESVGAEPENREVAGRGSQVAGSEGEVARRGSQVAGSEGEVAGRGSQVAGSEV